MRERVWVTKIDHTDDPPRPVEEVALEDGRVVGVQTFGRAPGPIEATHDHAGPTGALPVVGRSTPLVDRPLAWSPLNQPPAILDARDGRVAWDQSRSKVCIYGAGLGRDEAPLDDPCWTVWALNLVPPLDRQGRVRADAWWDIHQREAQTADDLRWIARCPVPIYVPADLLDASPLAVRYPIERVEAAYGSYFVCTFAYQIALALLEGFREIGLYGVELAYGTLRERTVEFACVSWWMGYAEATGVVFHLPHGSRLGRHPFRYGLEYRDEIGDVNRYLKTLARNDAEDARARTARASVGG